MNFATPEFLFVFLPLVLVGIAIGRKCFGPLGSLWVAVAASIVFYAAWEVRFLPIFAASIFFNYMISIPLARTKSPVILAFGIVMNLALLGWFKYAIAVTSVFGDPLQILGTAAIALPLGLSFFTFQQVGYLVDLRAGRATLIGPLHYVGFVSFFPQLVAGPIVHHRDLVPQLDKISLVRFDDPRFLTAGVFLLLGLAKKTLIADPIGRMINPAWGYVEGMSFYDAWMATFLYGFQLLMDFSAYGEIAIGLGLLMGIRLPVNFDSPMKSRSFTEFWRRWHITLGAFLRDYLYIPLGGSRHGQTRTLFALFTTMVLGGIWHGAGLTFMLWGAIHGSALCIERICGNARFRLRSSVAHFLTFFCVMLAWVPFRAETISDAFTVYATMLGWHGFELPAALASPLGLTAASTHWFDGLEVCWLLILCCVVLKAPNVPQIAGRFRPSVMAFPTAFVLSVFIAFSVGQGSEFIYWNW